MVLPKKLLRELKKHPPFRRKVYLACAAIPKGQTRSYGWIAKKIGSPGAARAVGQALAKHPFALLIPCHRVVGADGGMTGFSGVGGIRAKRRLLDRERPALGSVK